MATFPLSMVKAPFLQLSSHKIEMFEGKIPYNSHIYGQNPFFGSIQLVVAPSILKQTLPVPAGFVSLRMILTPGCSVLRLEMVVQEWWKTVVS